MYIKIYKGSRRCLYLPQRIIFLLAFNKVWGRSSWFNQRMRCVECGGFWPSILQCTSSWVSDKSHGIYPSFSSRQQTPMFFSTALWVHQKLFEPCPSEASLNLDSVRSLGVVASYSLGLDKCLDEQKLLEISHFFGWGEFFFSGIFLPVVLFHLLRSISTSLLLLFSVAFTVVLEGRIGLIKSTLSQSEMDILLLYILYIYLLLFNKCLPMNYLYTIYKKVNFFF